jgi:transcription elongation factor GreA
MNGPFLTHDGHRQALSQLEFLRTVKRAEVARRLREAQEAGGLTGNAVYEDVKLEQERLEMNHPWARRCWVTEQATRSWCPLLAA